MLIERQRVRTRVARLLDLAMMTAAFLSAAGAMQSPMGPRSLGQLLELRVTVASVLAFSLLLIGWHAALNALGLYPPAGFASSRREAPAVAAGATAATAILLVGDLVLDVRLITPAFLVAFWISGAAFAFTVRWARRALHRFARRGERGRRNLIIVGTNRRAHELYRRLDAVADSDYRFLGFVDDPWPGMMAIYRDRLPVIGTLGEAPRLLRDAVVDEVVLALPLWSYYKQASEVAAICAEQGITLHVVADLFPLRGGLRRTAADADPPIVTLYPAAQRGASAVVKRAIDVVVSLVLLVLLSPIFLLTAILIKLDSPGPIFFLQQRRGLHKRPFTMIKFRTMRPDAENLLVAVEALNEATGPSFKIRNDPRVTAVGRILRRLSIDELPQLLNVLMGDMSLVGPRPLFGWEYERIGEPWIKRRYCVKPGITGLWQVSGRSDLPFERRVELDFEYIDNWSLDLDFRILARTIPAVVRRKGAA